MNVITPVTLDTRSGLAVDPFTNQSSTGFADILGDLETQIARRADEIAATIPDRTPLNLYCWLQAEQEILTRFNLPERWAGSERT